MMETDTFANIGDNKDANQMDMDAQEEEACNKDTAVISTRPAVAAPKPACLSQVDKRPKARKPLPALLKIGDSRPATTAVVSQSDIKQVSMVGCSIWIVNFDFKKSSWKKKQHTIFSCLTRNLARGRSRQMRRLQERQLPQLVRPRVSPCWFSHSSPTSTYRAQVNQKETDM